MATDKSLNIRQLLATETTAEAIVELRGRLERIEKLLEEVKAAVAPKVSTSVSSTSGTGELRSSKLETAAKNVTTRK